METPREQPAWLDQFVWSVLWKAVAVAIATAAGLALLWQLRSLIGLLAISLFFALAIIPGVEALVRRFSMRRGAAVGIVYVVALAFLVFLVAVLAPGIARFAQEVGGAAAGWFDKANAWSSEYFGGPLFGGEAEVDTSAAMHVVQRWGDDVLGLVASGLGLVVQVLTIAVFTFYFAADFPRLMRALKSRMPPERQRVFTWVAHTSIQQTGGYFYSRLLLATTCGAGGFLVMLIVGLDLVYVIPLAVFMGFVSTFIPFIGTYLGAALPIVIVLAVEGPANAAVLLAWVLVYQQIENYLLSPKLSAKTMELNGAIAFGAAMAGGALAGPMGAFTALPVAALVTAIIKNSGRTYAVIEDGSPPRDHGDAGGDQAEG